MKKAYIEAAETVIGKTSKEEKLSYGLKQGVMRPHRSIGGVNKRISSTRSERVMRQLTCKEG